MEEESVVPFMMDNFQKYGFTFEETGIGDSMTVTTADGKETKDMTRAQITKGAFRVLTLKLGRAGVPMIVTNHTYHKISL